MSSFVSLAVAGLAVLGGARGHAYLSDPPARSTIAFKEGNTQFYWPSLGNGVGLTTVAPGERRWKEVTEISVCGDPFQETESSFITQPFESQVTYEQGAVISSTINISHNYGGKFKLYVCDATDPDLLTRDCFAQNPLTNMDSGSTEWWIQSDEVNNWSVTLNWKLPEAFSCSEGCVMMMEYSPMQNCIEECDCDVCGQYCTELGQVNPVAYGLDGGSFLPLCSDANRAQETLEIHRNCADITIMSSDDVVPSTPEPQVDGPEMAEPGMEGPEMEEPEMEGPEMAEPEMEGPETDEPEMDGPEMLEPEMDGPDAPDAPDAPVSDEPVLSDVDPTPADRTPTRDAGPRDASGIDADSVQVEETNGAAARGMAATAAAAAALFAAFA